MTDHKATLRFDHREIAVIFSLFIFVSLLMFTVGILVGKGLAQAKYEGVLLMDHRLPLAAEATQEAPAIVNSPGTSVSTEDPRKPDPVVEIKTAVPGEAAPATAPAAAAAKKAVEAQAEETPPLELVPKESKSAALAGTSLREPSTGKDTDDLLKNPKLRALVEGGEPPPKKRPSAKATPAPVTAGAAAKALKAEADLPSSLPKGPFTVQVGSYPGEKDAAERVEALKKLGFPHAYFSAKQWNDTKEIWYRVWLGYYPDYDSAKKSGKILQQRGEVTNYLVRKSDSAG